MADKPFAEQAAAFGSTMNSINTAQVVEAAVRDYKRDVLDKQPQNNKGGHQLVAMDELMEDEELQALHEERIARLKAEREKRNQQAQKGHGTYTEISEGDFLEIVTNTDMVVVHFFHPEFERCKIMDKHLATIAHKYFNTRFIKVSAPDSPFFTVKLNIKTLPCLIAFKKGVAVGRVTGFEGLGKDDFPTVVLEDRLLALDIIELPERDRADEDRIDGPGKNIRKSLHFKKTDSDEDSDFD
ncbi:hypothetical protein CHLRE_17g717750v5 [Chlamydomonas reinhardtii]|uniref:Uncharacterized protein n=1 Tax=Chlamydomonas reinhardtii TaxID=3055 RepID=A8JIF2_CHLRE|nr:uncharacterized protein CHLRE_17g717750v5 [Chlamydomonas reinhardtii]PNW70386.1 hypothetical protein CHLRE_17g717750v5 [Chlamydomonas reinhardtii]|eukprot:XP_001703737.1 thioredoxin-like/ATP binding protein [Chlamydomonas reinhardtii]